MDAINACDKKFKKVCIVGIPEAKDSTKRMEVYEIVGWKSQSSWAEICQHLLKDKIRVYEVKSYKKYRKREIEQKMKIGTSHLQDMEEFQMIGLKRVVRL